MTRIVIGIVGRVVNLPLNFAASQRGLFVPDNWSDLIRELGALPLPLPVCESLEDARQVVAAIDGLILPGGLDVDPRSYKAKMLVAYEASCKGIGDKYHRPLALAPDYNQDQSEVWWYQAARSTEIPVLGICRGMQIINVAHGGTLLQEIPDTSVQHCLEPDGWVPYHSIAIEGGSILHDLLGLTQYFTSSVHHQAIETLGEGLHATAFAADGVTEAIEINDGRHWVIGIQGHPEKTMRNLDEFRNVLTEFARQSRKRREARQSHRSDLANRDATSHLSA